MIKILFVLNGLGLAGAETYNVSLMNKFAQMGYHTDVCVLSDILNLASKVDRSINIFILKRSKRIDFKVIKELAKIIDLYNYDIVVSTSRIYMQLARCFTKKLPIIFYPIHSTLPSNRKEFFFNYLNFHTKTKREIFITSSDSQTDFLENFYNLGNGFFEQISNGIDTEFYCLPPPGFDKGAFLRNIGLDESDKIILMVAGYKPVKNHLIAVDAFNLLKHKYKNWNLIFVGNDHYNFMSGIQNYAKQISDNIIVINDVNNEKLLKYYWSADLFTLTSKSEAFPISALEAMATGLPCVLPDVGGIKDLIYSGVNGELTVRNSVLDISEKWEKVLMNLHNYSPIKIRDIVCTTYSINSSATQYLDIMRKYIKC
jgi:glycosyltransferase involved in cell wall biosynthesis